jgi:hypothetical protein
MIAIACTERLVSSFYAGLASIGGVHCPQEPLNFDGQQRDLPRPVMDTRFHERTFST